MNVRDINKQHSVPNWHGYHIDWKTCKMGKHFPFREKSRNFEHAGKVIEKVHLDDLDLYLDTLKLL